MLATVLRPKRWLVQVDPSKKMTDQTSGVTYVWARCACCERCWAMIDGDGASCFYGGPFTGYTEVK